MELRRDILKLDAKAEVYRVVNSDGDGLSGLIIDRYADVLLADVHSLGVWQRLDVWLPHLHALLGTQRQIVRMDPDIANIEGLRLPREDPKQPRTVRVRENGIRYEVNFAEGTGMECLKTNVDALLTKIKRKYKEYGINEKPFVIVKADNGTYGMGIMTVRDVKDLDVVNRKTRNKMSVVKDGQEVNQVIIQEGVLTHERLNDAVAEPVVYMMDRYVVGGFYRVHADRGVDENLNAPGASFVPLAFEQSAHTPQPGMKPGASTPNRFYMYGVIGRLAMLAASYELEATDPEAENYD